MIGGGCDESAGTETGRAGDNIHMGIAVIRDRTIGGGDRDVSGGREAGESDIGIRDQADISGARGDTESVILRDGGARDYVQGACRSRGYVGL